MTTKQLQSLLRQAMRYISTQNSVNRAISTNLRTGRIHNRSVALDVARTDMLLAKMRRAVARPKAARKAK